MQSTFKILINSHMSSYKFVARRPMSFEYILHWKTLHVYIMIISDVIKIYIIYTDICLASTSYFSQKAPTRYIPTWHTSRRLNLLEKIPIKGRLNIS